MPILATLAPFPEGPSPYLDSRMLALRTIDQSDIQPFTRYDEQWVILPGATGLGLPPRELVTQTTPGLDGGWLREVRVGIREVFLPLYIASNAGQDDFFDKMDRLRGFLDFLAVDDMTATDGTLELVATSSRGERYLRVAYSDGLQGTEGGDASGAFWATHGLKLIAVDPYWRAGDETVFDFSNVPGAPFLSTSGTNPWPRQLVPSVSLGGGGLTVTVPGVIPVWPRIEITGPASSTVVSWTGPLDEATHVELGAVGTGELLTMDTDPRRRDVTVNGDAAWSRVAAAPRFGRLKPGEQPLGVAVTGTDPGSHLRVRFASAFASPW